MNAPRDFDVGVARRLAQLEKQLAYLQSIVVNPGLSQGTWSPAFAGTGTAGVFTYTARQGYYVKIGDMVFIFGRVSISAIGTPPTGTMRITGLPFACNATYYSGVYFTRTNFFNYTAAAIGLEGLIIVGTTRIDLTETFDNASIVNVPAANFTNVNCELLFSGVYLT